jgi:hypothetical protein
MSKQNSTQHTKQQTKEKIMIQLTLEQAKTAIEIVESDMAASAFGEVEFANVNEMEFYLRRAQLLQRLKSAISAAKSE